MALQKIHYWNARRAGGRITITGIDTKGDPVKVTRIESIQHTRHGPLAVRDNGEHFRLA